MIIYDELSPALTRKQWEFLEDRIKGERMDLPKASPLESPHMPDWLFRDLLDWEMDGLTTQAQMRISKLLNEEALRRNFKDKHSAYITFDV